MKKSLRIFLISIASIALSATIIHAASLNVTNQLGGSSGDSFDIDGAIIVDSMRVGAQGVGGVTFFNGTIVNETTNDSGLGMPVTFGDDVRIDGLIYRSEIGGDNPIKIADSLRPSSNGAYSLGSSDYKFKDAYLSGTLTVDTLSVSSLEGSGIVSSNNILNGSIKEDDILQNAITSDLIDNGTIATADISDGAVSYDKISGPGGTNLPIAYGVIDADGNILGGTSNFTCTLVDDAPGVGDWYEISIEGESLSAIQHVTIANTLADGGMANIFSNDGNVVIYFRDFDGDYVLPQGFYFVTYKL